ncbi:MAG: lysophospholipid acyltransferase family protein [Deltaproteobacteria bacterium]|nr:lysophospholipid acyltransferase family protein [Deltaproteobacteria bacterium]
MNILSSRQWIDERWPVWGANLLKFLSRLVRTRYVGVEQAQGITCGVAHWHGDELALMPCFGHLALTILVSHSKDGEIMAKATRAMGYRVTRGSSTRGAVGGLIALIRAVKEGHTVVLAVDGPQGPRGVCKPGIIRIVQKTGAPLFPVGVAVSHRFVFKKTWNQVYLPLPFSRRVIFVDNPISFSKTYATEEMDPHCRQVERALQEAHKKARQILEGRT